MATDKQRDEFQRRLQELLEEIQFKDFNIFIMIKDMADNTYTLTGTMCMVCALDELEDYIDENNIKHTYNSNDDETTH